MIEFLIYDLKVAVLLAVFYMFYRLMLARETFHHVNRIVLLLTAVASFVLPLCVITIHETVVVQRAAHVACDRRGECHAPMADRLTCVIYNRYGDNPRTHTLIVIQNHQNH